MRARSVAAAVVLVVAAGMAGPVAAASAVVVGSLHRDTLMLTSSGTWMRSPADQNVLAADVLSGKVVISSDSMSSSSLQIALAGGALPQGATTYTLGSSSSANRVLGACGSSGAGTLRVDDVAYSGTSVTRLAASYSMRCGLGTTWATGTIRIGTTAPVAQLEPKPVTAPLTGRAKPVGVTVTFTNTGNGPTGTMGAATLDPAAPGSADFVVSVDRCGGTPIAPGGSCTVDLRFSRATAGTSGALLGVAAPGGTGRWLAGVSGTAVQAPAPPSRVSAFAARAAAGVTWWKSDSSPVTAYHVQRLDAGAWIDASGPLAESARVWTDPSVSAGAGARYRVVAENQDGPGLPSSEVTATRQAVDPTAGSVAAITVDNDPGGQALPPGTSDVVATDGIEWTPRPDGYNAATSWLSWPGGSVELPDVLPGPGTYAVDNSTAPAAGSFRMSAYASCSDSVGSLTVDEISYTSAAVLETLSAHVRLACPDGTSTYGDLRWNSTRPYAVVRTTPVSTDLGRTRVGTSSAETAVSVTNAGTRTETLGPRTLTGSAAPDWAIVSDSCGSPLAPSASCTVVLRATPSASGPRTATLVVADGTPRGHHGAGLTVTGTSLPSSPTAVSAQRIPNVGVDLRWSPPSDFGGTGLVEYVVRRTTTLGTPSTVVQGGSWMNPDAPADATYSVAAVSEVGTGPDSTPVAATSEAEWLLAAVADTPGTSPVMSAAPISEGSGLFRWPTRSTQSGTAWGLGLSPDGRTLASVQSDTSGWTLWREPLDRSVEPTKLFASTARQGQVRWSPDGTRIVLAQSEDHTVRVLDAVTGAVQATVARLDDPEWLPDSRTLVASDQAVQEAPLVRVDASTGRRLSTLTGTAGGQMTTVSPDGRWIAYRSWASGSPGLYIVPTGGGTPRLAAPLWASGITWSPDGQTLALSNGASSGGWWRTTVSADGSATDLRQVVPDRWTSFGLLTWTGTRVSIAPSAAQTGPRATFTVLPGGLPGGTTYQCAVDASAPVACSTAVTTGTLATGAHTLRVWSHTPDGRVSVAARSFTVDATPPVSTLAAPTAATTTSTSVAVAWSGSDAAGVASYDVRYRRAGVSGVFGAYVSWLNATRSTRATSSVAAGYRYCYSVRARDTWGNLSGWSAERCSARMLDDRSMKAATTGWSRPTSTAFYSGTATSTTRKGAALTVGSVRSRQVYLLVTKCSSCGSVSVYVGSTRVGTASLYASRTANRVLVTLPATSLRSGALKVLVTSASGKLVRIDGVALRST